MSLTRNINMAIVGSRKFIDYELMKDTFTKLVREKCWDDMQITVISGGAKGADTLAERLADDFKLNKNIMLADWNNMNVPGVRAKTNQWGKEYNANAGHDRNKKMAEAADVVLAFWDGTSPGTKSMIKTSEKLGKIVHVEKV